MKTKRSFFNKALNIACNYGFFRFLPDKSYLKLRYRLVFGKKLNLKTPKTFNEKIQWLKLYDRKPEYTKMVDKAETKEYIADLIGEEYIIPTLGVWDRFDDIDFDSLPNRFVLKCTHDSGGLVICKDKSTLDLTKAKKILENSLCTNYYQSFREWPYRNVKPRIIAETYMEDASTSELRDYKFFCFNGEVKALFVATERQKSGEEVKFDFFDPDYQHLPFRQGHPNAKELPQKPSQFEKMKELASILSKGIPHARIDFYEANGKIYFGEITFSHFSGFAPFDPPEWDETFGSWITLPEK